MSRHIGRVGVPSTLTTVADRAGVSRQTVSNALNNPELLRPETLTAMSDLLRERGAVRGVVQDLGRGEARIDLDAESLRRESTGHEIHDPRLVVERAPGRYAMMP